MQVIDSNKTLKYGIGIFTDVSEIEFEKREFPINTVSVLCHPDRASQRVEGSLFSASTLALRQNLFFAKTSESGDIFNFIIPKNYSSKEPITFEIKANHKNALCNLQITIEENSDVTLIEKIEPQEYLGLNVVLNIASNARVKYLIIQDTHEAAYPIITRTGNVGKDASLEW
nr:SufD family Fe-S cluster assembly protein [Candidatus Paceibacterota bacterium]